IYAGWFALTYAHRLLPWPVLAALGGFVLAWHGSLQHETIHGHPAGATWLGRPPLSLWLPYAIYRETHRRHHATEHLADPEHDPEALACPREEWARMGPRARALYAVQTTALGRLA